MHGCGFVLITSKEGIDMNRFRFLTAMVGVTAMTASALGTTRVAVVNIAVASERYLKTTDLEAKFEQDRVRYNEQMTALKQEVERTARSLQEELKPGTQDFVDRQKKLVMLEAEAKWITEFEGRKMEQGLAISLRTIYNDIQAVISQIAEEQGIDVVLAADRLPSEPPSGTGQARQQIILQKVLYWHPRTDLTDEVVSRLNAAYKAAKAASAPAGTSATPSPKP